MKQQDNGQDAVSPWVHFLTSSERAKLSLARALVMNPEVMLAERQLSNFNGKEAADMLKCLLEYVEQKGVCMPKCSRHLRRPRTLFYIPETVEQAESADVVWIIDRRGSAAQPRGVTAVMP